MWKCDNCDLVNYDKYKFCQACFRNATNLSPLQELVQQQQNLFHNFFQQNIIPHFKHKSIPLDIINLSQQFHTIDVNFLKHDNKDEQIVLLWDLALDCLKQSEYFMAYQLSKLIMNEYPNMLEDETNDSYGHFLKARVFDEWGAYKLADGSYQRAIESDPNCKIYKIWYGCMLEGKVEKFEEALKQFQDFLDIEADNIRWIYRCGQCLMKLGKYQQAKTYYDKAIEIAPDKVQPYFRYAKELRDGKRDYKESEKYYLKSLEIDDKQQYVRGSYGYLLYLMGEYEKAMKYVEMWNNVLLEEIMK